MIAGYRIAMGSTAVALALGGCASSSKPSASAPCEAGCLGLVMMLGAENAVVGANELPFALVRHPSEIQPSEGATSFRAIFAPDPPPPSFKPIEVQVERIQGRPVIGAPGHRQMRFDYVAKVVFDRPGPWTVEMRVGAPWQVKESVWTIRFQVVENRPNTNPA